MAAMEIPLEKGNKVKNFVSSCLGGKNEKFQCFFVSVLMQFI